MKIKGIVIGCIIALLLIACVILGFLYAREVVAFNLQQKGIQSSLRVLQFRNLFIEKVVLADKEVDYNTRLQLENSVRSLQDPEILNQWESFTNSQTKEEATTQAKAMIELLIKKSIF